jgi:hypothetical protein
MRSATDTIAEIISLFENDNNVTFTEIAKTKVQKRFEKLKPEAAEFLRGLSDNDLSELCIGDYDGPIHNKAAAPVNRFLDWIFVQIESGEAFAKIKVQ